ncbi:MAG: MerR family transcriptional regulator [Treponema sp.]|nr:MerR family transcriptional regulator [Treponema sp.]
MDNKPKEGLHKIKEFAETFGITPKALKVYEQYGLFHPAYVDEFTGYRYYTQSQIVDLSRILMLKDLGFALREIKHFLNGRISINVKLDSLLKQRHLLDILIEHLSIFAKTDAAYAANIKTLPAHHAYTVQYLAKDTNNIICRFSRFNDEMIRSHLQFDRHIQAYAVFHDKEFKLTDISLSLYSIVAKKGKDTVYVPPKKAASVLHFGEYEKLNEAYDFLSSYCVKNKLTICGDPIEYYLTGSDFKTSGESTLTEVCFPIEQP